MALFPSIAQSQLVTNRLSILRGKTKNLDYEGKRQKVLDELQRLGSESEEILAIIRNEDVVKEIKSDKLANLKFLEDNYGVGIGVFREEMRLRLRKKSENVV